MLTSRRATFHTYLQNENRRIEVSPMRLTFFTEIFLIRVLFPLTSILQTAVYEQWHWVIKLIFSALVEIFSGHTTQFSFPPNDAEGPNFNQFSSSSFKELSCNINNNSTMVFTKFSRTDYLSISLSFRGTSVKCRKAAGIPHEPQFKFVFEPL